MHTLRSRTTDHASVKCCFCHPADAVAQIYTFQGTSSLDRHPAMACCQCHGALQIVAMRSAKSGCLQIFSPSRLPSPVGDTGSNLLDVLTHVSKGYVGAALPNPKTAADMPLASGAVITEGTRKACLATP